MSISDDKYFKQVFNTGKDLIEKGLTDNDELERLGYYSSNGETTWMQKWWIPINWCCRQVQKEQLSGKINEFFNTKPIFSVINYRYLRKH